MYRVFGCKGGAGTDVLIDAYLRAHAEGANIITASLGGTSGWNEEAGSVVLSRLVAQGVIVTVSAGNSGDSGLFYASGPAGGKNVAAIASFDNTVTPWLQAHSKYAIDNGTEQDFPYAIGSPSKWGGVKLPLWTPSFNTTEVAMGCEPYPEDTPDLSGKIVLIRRGTCPFATKTDNAALYGARYFLFYNNVPGGFFLDLVGVENVTSVGLVEGAVGADWAKDLAAGKTVTLIMSDSAAGPIDVVETPNTATGGSLSDYTSWGPSFEADLKPQFGTPGGNILSTWPSNLGSYAVISGTSMSCPLAAGIYALLSEARGTFDPLVLQNVLAATAKPAPVNINKVVGPQLAPVAQQGAGLLQAYDAAYAVTVLSESGLAFNDTVRLVDKHFTISNTGHEDVTYELDVIGAGTAYTFSNDTKPDVFPGLDIDDIHAIVELSDYKITVPAGGKGNITVKVTPPSVDVARLPVYSGYIRLNATNGERLSLPYQGIAGDLSSHVALDSAVSVIRILPDGDKTPVGPGNSTFLLSRPVNNTNLVDALPALSYELVFGSPQVNVEVLSVSNYSVGLGHGNFSRNLGDIQSSPVQWYARIKDTFLWNGQLKDNSTVPAGSYKFRISATHIFSKPGDGKVETYESDAFSIQWK